MENPSWTRTFQPGPIWTISGVRRSRFSRRSNRASLKRSRRFLNHLPAAKGMTAEQVRQTRIPTGRLRNRQLLARPDLPVGLNWHATWSSCVRSKGPGRLQVWRLTASDSLAGMLDSAQILIDGDRFRTESPEATYEGIFNINVEAEPHEIDIEFVEGPEAGNWNFGIFRLDGDQLELCLDLNGKPRPSRVSHVIREAAMHMRR